MSARTRVYQLANGDYLVVEGISGLDTRILFPPMPQCAQPKEVVARLREFARLIEQEAGILAKEDETR